MSDTLNNKYRPQTFDEVIGQDDVVKSLRRVLREGSSRAFLLVGPAGTGKTTLARIIGKHSGVEPSNMMEINGAVHTGIDAMKDAVEGLVMKGLGKSGKKLVIVDECQAISKAAWSALLKPIEEPPAHVMWALATTDAGKVPAAITTRCAGGGYTLKPVSRDLLFAYVKKIAKEELYDIDEDTAFLIADRAMGSPRMALTMLAAVSHCETRAEAAAILRAVDEGSAGLGEIIQGLLKNSLTWDRAAEAVKGIEGGAEGARIQLVAYFEKVALNAKSEKTAIHALEVIGAFSQPYPATTGMYPFLLSLGNVIFK